MKVRVFESGDGVSVIHPASKSRRMGETEEQWLDRIFTKSMPQGAVYEDMEDTNLPSRKYRSAWELDGKKIKINVQKKQEISDKKNLKENIKKNTKLKLKDLGLTNDEIETIVK